MGGTVRGEEEQLEGASPRQVRTGPRHAAPRKSMLTRLQVPAGKAIALAAMPTAVLMGMGLTPQLASASPRADDRFKAGPCVSQPDEADKADKADKGDAKGKETADPKGDAKDDSPATPGGSQGDDGATADPNPSAGKPAPTPSPSDSQDAQESKEPSASPSPSESESRNPLDPLGLGDALHKVIGGDEEKSDASAEPSASSTTKPSPSPSGTSDSAADKATDPVKDTVDKVGQGAQDAADKAKKTVEDTKDQADKALPTPSPSASKGAGGKEAFPCPEFDADAYKNADAEKTPNLLPDDPWTLKSTLLSLHGLDYQGIVEIKTYSGKVKKVLKFTAKSVDIKDLHQTVIGPGGTTTHVQAREGSKSTIRNGTVTMYTEELKGNLLGIIPITFSPKSPPPLNLPEVFFTNVTVKQAGQFGGDLTVPGMHLYKTGE